MLCKEAFPSICDPTRLKWKYLQEITKLF